MDPQRKQTINGHTVTEYYWNGRYVVYIDSKLFDGSFAEAIASCR